MSFVLLLASCGWFEAPHAPLDEPTLTSRLIALESQLLAAQDRITELERRDCLTSEELTQTLSTYPDRHQLAEAIEPFVDKAEWLPMMDDFATLGDLEDALEDTVAPLELEEQLGDLVSREQLRADLSGYLPVSELPAKLAPFVTKPTLERSLTPYATREWTDAQYVSHPNRVVFPTGRAARRDESDEPR